MTRFLEHRVRWMRRGEFLALFAGRQADAGLTEELAELTRD